jgi:thiamine pyrophosphate-dependent acetolactate synthase large subunit-like protein
MLGCDVLVMLGADFPYRQFIRRREGVQVDIAAKTW